MNLLGASHGNETGNETDKAAGGGLSKAAADMALCDWRNWTDILLNAVGQTSKGGSGLESSKGAKHLMRYGVELPTIQSIRRLTNLQQARGNGFQFSFGIAEQIASVSYRRHQMMKSCLLFEIRL